MEVRPSKELGVDQEVPDMHGGLPIIGFSTLIYGAVALTAVAGRVIMKLRGRR